MTRSAPNWAEIFATQTTDSVSAAERILGDLTGYRDSSPYKKADIEQLASALGGWLLYMQEEAA